jgi:ABC-type branched-subunit amino acid transport system substrate-binding protein
MIQVHRLWRSAASALAVVAVVLVGGCSSSSSSTSGTLPVQGATTSQGASSAPAAQGTAVSSLKLPFTPTVITYGSSAAEANVAPPAPAGGNGGATAPGVTATSIQLGQLISLTGLAPGVFQGVANSAKAYANYVNSLGGVYGRKLTVQVGDDAFDVVKDQAVCQQMVPQVFALVGGMATADAGCYPLMKSTGIPVTGPIVYDPQIYALPNAFVPQPDYYSNLFPAIQVALHPSVKKVWLCEQDVPGIAAQAAPEAHAWESLGVQVLNLPPLASNSPDYTAAVVQAKDAGAQAVDCFSPDAQVTAAVAQAMAQQGWDPPVKMGYSIYSSAFLNLAGSAANGWSADIQVPTLNQAEFLSTPAGQLYKKWNGTIPQTSYDYYGWEYMNLAVQALVKAGPNLTRANFLAALKTIHSFTAGGLIPPFDPGNKGEPTTCLSMVQIVNGQFTQVVPQKNQLVCGGKFFS